MIKKVIGWLMLVVTTVSLSVVVGVNGNYIFHKKDWYTKQQVEEKVDEAYNKGLDVNKNGDIFALATEYKLKYDESKAQAEALEKELDAEKLKNSLLSENVKSLTETKESAEAEVVRLNNVVLENERTISSKENEISNLEKDVASLENSISNNETIISNKQNRIEELESELLKMEQSLNESKLLVLEKNTEISDLQIEMSELQKTNSDNEIVLNSKQNRIEELEAEVSRLEALETSKNSDISSLKNQISTLKNEISIFETENTNKDNQIVSLNSQISNLQCLNSQLQATNELNLQTINNLNSQITSLNTQITDMTFQLQNNSSNVSKLNNKIAELEKSISYYEQYIANLENDEKVAITFEFNNTVYNIQIINKNCTCSVTEPTSTDYVIFNYWTVDGERIDLTTKTFSSNTKVVADVTYKYDVKFMVEETEYYSQIVTKNNYPTLPENPTKAGYEFDGWTKNGVDIVEPVTDKITQNTTYTAVFTKLHTVTFVSEDQTIGTQTVRNNNYATKPTILITTYKVFNGWKLNEVIVDVSTQKIVSDTTFVADWTYKYDVKFMVDEAVYNSQIVTENGYPTLPTNPTKAGYEFDGWMKDTEIVSPGTIKIIQNTTYTAKFTKLHTVKFVSEGTTIETRIVRDGEKTTSVSVEGTDHKVFNGWKLNDTIVVVAETIITEDTTFVADYTYKYDVNFMVEGELYNSQTVARGTLVDVPEEPIKHTYAFVGWMLDDEIVDFETYHVSSGITFVASFKELVFVEDESSFLLTTAYFTYFKNNYYSMIDGNICVLNKDNKSWDPIVSFDTDCYYKQLYADDTYLYFYQEKSLTFHNYIVDIVNKELVSFETNRSLNISATVFTYKGNVYLYDSGLFVLNKETHQYETAEIPTPAHAPFVLNNKLYYFDYDSVICYEYDDSTCLWVDSCWLNIPTTNISFYWTDGNTLYCSISEEKQYYFDSLTKTWVAKTWNGRIPYNKWGGPTICLLYDDIYNIYASTVYKLTTL